MHYTRLKLISKLCLLRRKKREANNVAGMDNVNVTHFFFNIPLPGHHRINVEHIVTNSIISTGIVNTRLIPSTAPARHYFRHQNERRFLRFIPRRANICVVSRLTAIKRIPNNDLRMTRIPAPQSSSVQTKWPFENPICWALHCRRG